MKRGVFAVLALLAAPVPAAAQGLMTGQSPWGPRFRFTPFVGMAPTVSRAERWVVAYDGDFSAGNYDVKLGAGPLAGASLEVRLIDRFALIGSGYFVKRSETREYSQALQEYIVTEGSDFLVARAALAIRMRENVAQLQKRSVTASVFAGPAYVREMPSAELGPILGQYLDHWAASFGVDADVPLGGGAVALQFGLEDFYTFWNTTAIASRNDAFFADSGFATQSSLETDASNMVLFRVGLSFRF